jgi:peptidoglycan/xylan/chitin deacetylase (PgdA/CDA1 family)
VTKHIVTAATILLGISAPMTPNRVAANDAQSVYGTVQTYRQVLLIESSPDLPKPGPPSLAAVYDGHKWGLSTRWDDSNPNALNIRRKMLENGIRGTFYLNSRKPEESRGSLACELTGGGECSVGGHSVSHPHLPKLPANEVFYELMANRIALECLTDRPVNSLAFPFGGYQDKDRPEVMEGVTEAFLRTGYHHCVYANFVTKNPFLPAKIVSTGLQVVPGDRQVDADKFWKQIGNVRKFGSQYRKKSDCIFLGVHPWQEGAELERLGEVLGELSDWDDFWHCTQTEYAAFAKQRQNTTIEETAPGEFTIVRPGGFELGSQIPLTLAFDGDSVRGAKVDGVACSVRRAEGKTFVNVPHASGHGVPVKIDETSKGISEKFPGLKASLEFDPKTGQIAYSLENGSNSTLSSAALTLSTPPAFEPGMRRWKRPELVQGESWSVTVTASQSRTGTYWQSGRHYAAAQLDFVLNGKRGRLFATCAGS